MRKPRGYWQKWENVKKELIPICKELGHFPSNTELRERGLTTLARYLKEYHGGALEVANKLGYKTYDHFIGRRMQGYWDLESTIREYIRMISEQKLSYYPSKKEIIDLGHMDLWAAISKLGGYEDFKIILKEKYNLTLSNKDKTRKWTKKLIEKELIKLGEELGYIPSSDELDQMGKTDLRGAINKQGGVLELSKTLSIPTKSKYYKIKESKYWKDINNLKQEIQPIIDAIGHFPTYTELILLERQDIVSSFKYFGGIEQTANSLGYHTVTEKYKTLDGHLVRSIFEIVVDNFLFINDIAHETEGVIDPSSNKKYMYDFKVMNENGETIFVEIWGYRKERQQSLLEENYNRKRLLKEEFYKRKGLILISLEEKLFNKSFKDIYQFLVKVCKEYKIKKDNFYSKCNNIDLLIANAYSYNDLYIELKPLIENNDGYMLSIPQLRRLKREDLVSKIAKFGGAKTFRNRFNLKLKPKKLTWDDDEIFHRKLLEICKKLNKIPTRKDLLNLGRGDILGAINKRGGIIKVTQNEIYEPFLNKVTKWSSWDDLKKWLIPVCEELNRFPTESELIKRNLKGLYKSLPKYGGAKEVAHKLGYYTYEETKPDWKDFNYCKLVLVQVIEEIGRFPKPIELTNRGYDGLVQSINKYHGGFEEASKSLGYKLPYTPIGKNKDWHYVRNVILELQKELGYFPRRKDLLDSGYSGLYVSICKYYGGLSNIKARINNEDNQEMLTNGNF